MTGHAWRQGHIRMESVPIADTRWLPRLWAWLTLREPPVVKGLWLVTWTDMRTGCSITFEQRSI